MAACLFPISPALHGHYGDEASTKFVDYAQLDAFTAEPFKGNPAFVCLLPIARSKEWMQNVAAEFNAPMAAFLVHRASSHGNVTTTPEECNSRDTTNGAPLRDSHSIPGQKASEYNVRFFTPTAEVELCGHATLASAHLLFTSKLASGSEIFFHAESTTLKVRKITGGDNSDGDEDWHGQMELTFPIVPTSPMATNMEPALPRSLQGCEVISTHTSTRGWPILELPSARAVETLQPCFEEILAGPGAVIVTAKGSAESPFDFVSRFFAPRYGVPEDPVCGTAHCALAPLWAAKLGKRSLVAYQASKRGGVLDLFVDHHSKCVLLRGTAVLVATGVLLC